MKKFFGFGKAKDAP